MSINNIVSTITLGPSLEMSGSTMGLSPLYGSVSIGQINDLSSIYATPVKVLDNPVSGGIILVDKVVLDAFYLSGSYSGGGNFIVQYGNTVHGVGPAATVTVPATAFLAISQDCQIRLNGSLTNPSNNSVLVDQDLYVSNDTGAFIGSGVAIFGIVVYYSVYQP